MAEKRVLAGIEPESAACCLHPLATKSRMAVVVTAICFIRGVKLGIFLEMESKIWAGQKWGTRGNSQNLGWSNECKSALIGGRGGGSFVKEAMQ